MSILKDLLLLLGSIAVFLSGLKLMSDEVCNLSGEKMKKGIKAVAGHRCGAVLAGCAVTAIAQSSIATNMIVIGFVEGGVMTFMQAAATIMGTNIGTTMTAQLVSFSQGNSFDITAIGCGMSFIGVIMGLMKNPKVKSAGGAMCGFGFIFIGLMLMTDAVENFKNYVWFKNLFLVENPLVLFLNGLIITTIIQSSSVATGMMVVLGSIGLLPFEKATFLILGSNIGTCIPVIIASADKSAEAKKSALFNIIFNIIGSIIFFLPLVLAGSAINELPFFKNIVIGRKIANFHTFFNTVVCLLLLIPLKYVCALTEKVYDLLYGKRADKKTRSKKKKRAAVNLKARFDKRTRFEKRQKDVKMEF